MLFRSYYRYGNKSDKSISVKKCKKEEVKNKDLWLQLDSLCEIHQVDWQWIKGHSGHAENEECDHLAQEEAKKIQTAAST